MVPSLLGCCFPSSPAGDSPTILYAQTKSSVVDETLYSVPTSQIGIGVWNKAVRGNEPSDGSGCHPAEERKQHRIRKKKKDNTSKTIFEWFHPHLRFGSDMHDDVDGGIETSKWSGPSLCTVRLFLNNGEERERPRG